MTQTTLVTATELQQDRLEEGDAAVILKADGSFRVAQFHAPGSVDPRLLTERQMSQGVALLAFAFLLRTPEMMEIVAGMASDEKVKGVERGALH